MAPSIRLEQHGWTRASWGKTENNRDAKYYAITKAGLKGLEEETARWRQMSGVVEKLLAEEYVALVPGEAFGTNEHIRISYATSMNELERGLNRLAQFIAARV